MDPVAKIDLICCKPDGKEIPVEIRIGRPYLGEDGLWACPVSLERFYSRLSDVKSDDSFQSLCLALHLVKKLLIYSKNDGGRIYFAHNKREAFPLEAYFPGICYDGKQNDRLAGE